MSATTAKKKGKEPGSPDGPAAGDKRYNNYSVTPEEFIEVWQTSDSAEAVAQKLKMPKPIVHARVSTYRSAGVKLKKMKRKANRKLNVEELNALIDHLNAEKKPAAKPETARPQPPEEQVVSAVNRVISRMRR